LCSGQGNLTKVSQIQPMCHKKTRLVATKRVFLWGAGMINR